MKNFSFENSEMSYPIDDSQLGVIENLTVVPFSFNIKDNFRNRGLNEIHFWCKDRNSETYLLRVHHFPVYGCLELPKYDDDTKEIIPWNYDLARRVFEYFAWSMTAKGIDPPTDFSFCKMNDVYDFSPIKKNYLYLFFNNDKGRYGVSSMCSRVREIRGVGKIKLISHEMSVNSLRRLMSIRDCNYSSWFRVESRLAPLNYSDRYSVSTIKEYFINWKTLEPIDGSLTKDWVIYPSVFAWDIETYSDNHRSMPSEYNLKHCVYLISGIYQLLGKPETKRSYCIIYGESDDVEGVTIIRVKSELEGLIAFCSLVVYLDPDITSGYNIFSYDFPYIIARFSINAAKIPQMGRILNTETEIYDKSWQSSGYGKNTICFIVMDGRIPIDLLPNIKRLIKLRKYSLDFVSHFFLGKGKHDISAPEMFSIYEKSLQKRDDGTSYPEHVTDMTRVLSYCVEDSNLVVDLFEKVKLWYHLTELSGVAGVPILDLFIRGEQIRCYSQISHQCYKRGFVLSNPHTYDYYYSGGFVAPPVRGIHEYVFTFDFSSLYPSIMQAYNLCYNTFIPQHLWNTVREEDCHIIIFEQEEPLDHKSSSREEDGYDDVPDNGYEEEKNGADVIADDKEKIMRKYEFRFVKPHIRVGIMPDLERGWVADRKKVKNELKVVEKQLKKLGADIDDLKKEGNSDHSDQLAQLEKNYRELNIRAIVLDKRQLAIKVLANSGYGFTGVKHGYLPGLPIAMCTTALGRRLVGEANKFFVEKYAHLGACLAYGDTDSSMISLKLNGTEDIKAIGEEMADAISGRPEKILKDGTVLPAIIGIFPDPLKMEFEDCCRILCLKKKMYAKAKRNLDTGDFYRGDDGKIEISSKGIMTAKKGKNKLSTDIYSDALDRIINKDSLTNTLRSLVSHFTRLMNDELDTREYLTMVQELGSNYKNEWYEMNLFQNYLSRLGHPVKPGDRLEYIVVRIPEEDENLTLKGKAQHKIYKGNKMREITLWEQNPNREEIDYLYYIEKGLCEPYDFLFSVGFQNVTSLSYFQDIGWKPMFSRCHFVHFSSPIKMIMAFIDDLMKANDMQLEQLLGLKIEGKKITLISKAINMFVEKICDHVDRILILAAEQMKDNE